jgi:hypothetical protein
MILEVEGVGHTHTRWASVDSCPIGFKPISPLHAPTFYAFYGSLVPSDLGITFSLSSDSIFLFEAPRQNLRLAPE